LLLFEPLGEEGVQGHLLLAFFLHPVRAVEELSLHGEVFVQACPTKNLA